jgi:hypothetical protein
VANKVSMGGIVGGQIILMKGKIPKTLRKKANYFEIESRCRRKNLI